MEGAEFCQECGTRLSATESEERKTAGENSSLLSRLSEIAESSPVSSTAKESEPAPKKKKTSVGRLIVIAIVTVAAVFGIMGLFSAFGGNGEPMIDYVASVRAYKPFAKTAGLPMTCEEVFDKYISKAKWTSRGGPEVGYVDISGKGKNVSYDISITVSVKLVSEDKVTFGFESLTINGKETTSTETNNYLAAMFIAYSNDFNLSDVPGIMELKGCSVPDGIK